MNETITILSTKIIMPLIKKQLFENNIFVEEFEFIKTVSVLDKISLTTIKDHPPHYIFTSKKAVKFFCSVLKENKVELPPIHYIYCLDGETKKAVFMAGMRPTFTAHNAWQLAEIIYKKGTSKKFIFFCSDIRRADLPDYLSARGVEIKEIVLYKTLLVPRSIKTTYNGILFFSPSAIQSFFMGNKLNPSTIFFCIGATTASALREIAPEAEITIADKATQLNIAEKIINYYNSNPNKLK